MVGIFSSCQVFKLEVLQVIKLEVGMREGRLEGFVTASNRMREKVLLDVERGKVDAVT